MSDPPTRIPPRDGSAYGRPAQHSNKLLTEVGPGTPCGELLRRYWHPIAPSAELRDLPRKVKILGEELILFRDAKGRAGLLYPRCMHRGTSLFYGRIEPEGIRCCYHGWLFDVQGKCLEQPCEPDGGRPGGRPGGCHVRSGESAGERALGQFLPRDTRVYLDGGGDGSPTYGTSTACA